MRWTGKKLKENEKKERMCKMVSSMAIENVIQRSCINLHMKGRNKKEIIEEMAGMFDRAGVLSSRQMFIQAVYERESEGPTGIGSQVAIPHGKSDAVIKTAMAVGRVDRGGGLGDPWGRNVQGICHVRGQQCGQIRVGFIIVPGGSCTM